MYSNYQKKLTDVTTYLNIALTHYGESLNIYDYSMPLLVGDKNKMRLVEVVHKIHRDTKNLEQMKALKGKVTLCEFLAEVKFMLALDKFFEMINRFDDVVKIQEKESPEDMLNALYFGLYEIDEPTQDEMKKAIASQVAAIEMNRAYWKGVLERRDNIVKYTQDFGNVSKPTFNAQISQYYEDYYNTNHQQVEIDLTKKLYIQGNKIYLCNDVENLIETWMPILIQQCSSLEGTNLSNVANTNMDFLTNVESKSIIDTLLANNSSSFIRSVFDCIIENNYIKMKINPKLAVSIISLDELRDKLDTVLPYMSNQRHWFVVTKFMMKKRFVNNGDFKAASSLIIDAYDGYPPIGIDPRDLSRLNVGLYSKEVDLWYDKNYKPSKTREQQSFEIFKICQSVFL